jgi:hypothetical protein
MFEFIIPPVDDEFPLSNIPNRCLPLIASLQVTTFNYAPARESQEPGLHVFEQLHKISA